MIARFRRPVTEEPLVVLPSTENSERAIQLFIHSSATAQTEVGLVGQEQPTKCGAGNLFAAAMREGLQVLIEAVRQSLTERLQRWRLSLQKFRVKTRLHRKIDASAFEITAANIRHEGNSRSHAEGRVT